MTSITISIGRNIGAEPMTLTNWRDFISAVTRIIGYADPNAVLYVTAAESIGEWDGVSEQSRTWVGSIADESVDSLRAMLRALASVYEQDAIALSVGHTELITP